MIRYDEHAEFEATRRGIEKAWVEEAIRRPDSTETKAVEFHISSACQAGVSCCAWWSESVTPNT
jgi:hypothetical protein